MAVLLYAGNKQRSGLFPCGISTIFWADPKNEREKERRLLPVVTEKYRESPEQTENESHEKSRNKLDRTSFFCRAECSDHARESRSLSGSVWFRRVNSNIEWKRWMCVLISLHMRITEESE